MSVVVFDNSVVIRVASKMRLGAGDGTKVNLANSTRALEEENWIVTFPTALAGRGGVTWQMVLILRCRGHVPRKGRRTTGGRAGTMRPSY